MKHTKRDIIILGATASLETGGGKPLPSRLLVLPWGSRNTRKGLVVCNAATAAQLPVNQTANKRETVFLDFQHSTVEGSPFYKGEPQAVAASGTLNVVEGEGVYLENINWTKEGTDYAPGGHYPDISPAVITDEAGNVVLFHSVALVRQGEIDGLTLFSASLDITLGDEDSTSSNPSNPSTNQPSKTKSIMNATELLKKILKLDPSASDADVEAAAADLIKANEEAAAEANKATGTDDDVKALSADVKALSAAVTAIQSGNEDAQRQAIVDRATRDGKAIPLTAEQLKTIPVTTLSALVTGLPVTVQLDQRTPAKVTELSAGFQVTSSEGDNIRKNLGISKELHEKHNPKPTA